MLRAYEMSPTFAILSVISATSLPFLKTTKSQPATDFQNAQRAQRKQTKEALEIFPLITLQRKAIGHAWTANRRYLKAYFLGSSNNHLAPE